MGRCLAADDDPLPDGWDSLAQMGLLLGSRPTTGGLGSVGSTVPCGRLAGSSDTSGLS